MATVIPTTLDAPPHPNAKPLLLLALLFLLLGVVLGFNHLLPLYLAQTYSLHPEELVPGQRAYWAVGLLLALPAGWLVAQLGYARSLAGALLILAVGILLLGAAASGWGLALSVGGLALVGAGSALLQVAALPYAAGLEPERRAAVRLTLLGAAQALGSTLLPLLGNLLLAESAGAGKPGVTQLGPYLGLALALLVGAGLALVLAGRPHQPPLPAANPVAASPEAGTVPASAFGFRHLQLGALAVFAGAGVQAGVSAFFVFYAQSLHLTNLSAFTIARLRELNAGLNFVLAATGQATERPLDTAGGLTIAVAAALLGLHGLGLLVGRLAGVPLLLLVPGRTVLAVTSAAGAALVVAALLSSGDAALWLLVATGLASALVWPVVVSLALTGLGRAAPLGAGLLVLASLGGVAVVPLMGWLAAHGGWKAAFGVPVVGYLYLLYYALRGSRQPTLIQGA